MPINTEVDYNNVVIKGTVELGVKGERGLQGFKGDQGIQGPPVPVAHELGDDPDLAASQKLLTDSIADMEQSNEAAVVEAAHQAGLAGDSAVIATEQAGIAASRAGESEQSAQAAAQSAAQAEQTNAEVKATTAQFIESIHYDVVGNYAAGLVLDTSNSVVYMPDGTYWGVIKATTELPYTITGNLTTDGTYMYEIPFATMKSLEDEITSRQEADDNLQAQISGAVPLEASAFSPISWHKQEVQNSVDIPPNQNAWSFGPTMTIAAGHSVTIGENTHWTIANGEVQ